jgi:hypothetical protein
MVSEPLPLDVVAVMVAAELVESKLATPADGVEITLVLLEDQVAELVTSVPPWVAVKVMLPPLTDRLIVWFGEVPEQLVQLTVTVDDCPTVTVVDPLAVPDVAVMVIPVVVFAMPLINPLLLTVT